MLRAHLLAIALAAGLAVPAARATEPVLLAAPAAGAFLSLPPGAEATGVAILVPDVAGRNASARSHVEALLASGMAVLELDAEDEVGLYSLTGDGQARAPTWPDLLASIAAARQYLARHPRLSGLPVVLVGLGSSARRVAALEAPSRCGASAPDASPVVGPAPAALTVASARPCAGKAPPPPAGERGQ